MDIDIGVEEDSLEPNPSRNKTSLRLKYEAVTRVFRARFGGLDEVRRRLGLSRRQICQILLVDPSAWTRWCRDEDRVPPHIYRALEWYLTLESKTELHPQISRVYLGSLNRDSGREDLLIEIESLKKQVSRMQRLMRLSTALLALLLGLGGFWAWWF